ncbi:MAG: hypothetical protein IJS34_02500 [Alphaproteobacteria bacterium]|nr:hypothetical protein [Alphaproteobacteria bacterium]
MKKITSVFMVFAMFAGVAGAAPETARRSMVAQNVMPAPRSVTINAPAVVKTTGAVATTEQAKSSIKFDSTEPGGVAAAKDTRDKERTACMSNNIGVGNTFVWASRNSNISNYSSMIEDTDNPSNNVCFVRVELKSNDSRINVADFGGRYFEMGRNITCGSWADEEKLKQRILDAKKSARTWATVGGAVGGAAVGVGSMELFGNKLIGGKVQGQKAMEEDDLFESQLLVLKKDNKSLYNKIITELKTIKEECAKATGKLPANCTKYDYNRLLMTESK